MNNALELLFWVLAGAFVLLMVAMALAPFWEDQD